MKSGFVVLAGRSNVGKSSLLNALIGTKVAIVTPKPQTTRRPVRGVLHDERGQIVFVDTPGLFHGKKDILSQKLNSIVREQLEGIDLVVYVMDPTRIAGEEEEDMRKLMRKLHVPVIAAINKCDLVDMDKPALEEMRNVDVGQRTTLEISATTHHNLNLLVDTMFALLPEGEYYYPPQQLTDVSHRDWLAETIREKCFLRLEKELPYSVHVEIDDVDQHPDGSRFISGVIWTSEERYKKMLIGAGGSMIKRIGMDARKEIEGATGSKCRLELVVKTDPKWPQRFANI
ncbi:MAG: GTPase Era [Candidatus Uhrbacteria bacterium]